jgi:hypothetical protein
MSGYTRNSDATYMNVGFGLLPDPNKVGHGDYGPPQDIVWYGREKYYTPWNRNYPYPMPKPPLVVQPFGCIEHSKVVCPGPKGPRAAMRRV